MKKMLLNLFSAVVAATIVTVLTNASNAETAIVGLVWYAYSDIIDRIKER